MPEALKPYFEERRGFANYYFNALCQQRVWKAWEAASRLAPPAAIGPSRARSSTAASFIWKSATPAPR